MIALDIQSIDQITDEQVDYLVGLAQSLSSQSDFTIENYADSALTNPSVQEILQTEDVRNLLAGEIEEQQQLDFTGKIALLSLNFSQQTMANKSVLWNKIKAIFFGLKKKVRRALCTILGGLGEDSDLDIKAIIKDVLIALVPILAGTVGLMPIALAILVSLIALLLKYGIDRICPV